MLEVERREKKQKSTFICYIVAMFCYGWRKSTVVLFASKLDNLGKRKELQNRIMFNVLNSTETDFSVKTDN